MGGSELREAGVGWTFLRLFNDVHLLPDLADQTREPNPILTQIYTGTPRALLYVTEDVLSKYMQCLCAMIISNSLYSFKWARINAN